MESSIVSLISAVDRVPSGDDRAYAVADDALLAETRRLAEMPALTLDGVIFKAEWVERGADEELKDSIVADLRAMRRFASPRR